jgi:alpha-N-arabinofuranosidase
MLAAGIQIGVSAFAAEQAPVIALDHSNSRATHPNTHGFNMTAMYGAGGNLRPPNGTVTAPYMPQKLVDRVKAAGVSTLRFPAGTGGNTYRWKEGRGPLAGRGCWNPFPGQLTKASGMEYGIAEHLRFLDRTGAATTIVANFANGTPQDAADLVEYLNASVGSNPGGGVAWADKRKADGHPAPYGVTRLEVGNEMNHPGQTYWMGIAAEEFKAGEAPWYARNVTQRAHAYAFGNHSDDPNDHPYFPMAPTQVCQPTKIINAGTPDAQYASRDKTHSRYFVQSAPVFRGTLKVVVNGDDGWREVTSLAGHGPTEHVYQVNYQTGEIRFVAGVAGETASTPLRVTAAYRSGKHAGFIQVANKIRDVDPTVKVCSSFADEAFLSAMGTRAYDCLVAHGYRGVGSGLTGNEQHDRTMMYSLQVSRALAGWRELMGKHDNRTRSGGRPHTVVTEFGLTGHEKEPVAEHYAASMDATVYTAAVHQSAQQAGFPVMLRHALVSVNSGCPTPTNQPAGFLCDADYTPTGLGVLYDLLDDATARTNVATSLSGNPWRTNGSWQYPLLSATATRAADGTVRILVTNRGLGWQAARIEPGRAHRSNVDVSVVRGHQHGEPNCFDYNSASTQLIKRYDSTLTGAGNAAFSVTFHPNSVTLLTLRPPLT